MPVSYQKADIHRSQGSNDANNRFDSSAVVPNIDGSMFERLEELQSISRTSISTAQLLVTGTTIFTVTGGPILIQDLFSYCTVTFEATAFTIQWSADGSATGQAATTISAASGSLSAFAAGGVIYNNFTTINTAPVITQTAGVFLRGPTTSTGGGIVVPAGIITTTVTNGPSATGKLQHYMRWTALGNGCVVTAS